MPKPNSTRGEKWLYSLAAILIVALVAVGSLNGYLNRDPVIQIPAPIPTPHPNGRDLYLAAARSIVRPVTAVDPVNDTSTNLTPGEKAARYSLARREAWLQSQTAGLKLFKRALGVPGRVPEIRNLAGIAATGISGNNTELRELARNKIAEANTYKLRGAWSKAATTGLDTFQMSKETAHGGNLISWLVQVAIEALALSTFDDVPSHLTAPEARAALRRLEHLYPRPWELTSALTVEKWQGLSTILETMRMPRWRTLPSSDDLPLKARLRTLLLSKQNVIDDTVLVYDYSIHCARLPRGSAPPAPPANLNPWTTEMTPIFDKVPQIQKREFAGTDFLLYRLALRAYRLENGAYPARLRALVPKYLSRIYDDPFAKVRSPYGYRRKGDSYELWSVGADGINNNGVPVPNAKRKSQILIKVPPPRGDAVVGP